MIWSHRDLQIAQPVPHRVGVRSAGIRVHAGRRERTRRQHNNHSRVSDNDVAVVSHVSDSDVDRTIGKLPVARIRPERPPVHGQHHRVDEPDDGCRARRIHRCRRHRR